MSNAIKATDRAFPVTGGTLGMDLRTYLAGQALQGLIACIPAEKKETNFDPRMLAARAVKYADALIGALNLPEQEKSNS
jgi:hypothetical protein